MTETPKTAAPAMTIRRSEVLELDAMAAKLRADLSRFGDRWARYQLRTRAPVPDPEAREAFLVQYFADILARGTAGHLCASRTSSV